MILNDVLDVIDKEEALHIQFWDPNMSMNRDISEDNLSNFLRSNGNVEVKRLIPSNYKLTVVIAKPY